MPLAFLDRPPYPGLRSANNMTFPCQEGVVLYCITERFALRKHLPISLGHPPALPRAGQASSSPPRPAGVPADTLAKPLSLAAAGASFAAKVREPGSISLSVSRVGERPREVRGVLQPVYHRLLCVEHTSPPPPTGSAQSRLRGKKKPEAQAVLGDPQGATTAVNKPKGASTGPGALPP